MKINAKKNIRNIFVLSGILIHLLPIQNQYIYIYKVFLKQLKLAQLLDCAICLENT